MQLRRRNIQLLALLVLLGSLLAPLLASPALAQDQGIIIFGVDDDPDNKLFECERNRVGFGVGGDNLLRCFSFHYEIPPEGVTSALLHVEVSPIGSMQETDSTHVAVGEPFEDCAFAQGEMAGCITLHGGFTGDETFLNLDLFDIACDETANGSPEKQAALVQQVDTGTLHFMVQDDTVVHRAVLILNAGASPATCGTTSNPALPGIESTEVESSAVATEQPVVAAPGNLIPNSPLGTAEPTNEAVQMTVQAGQRQVAPGENVWVPVYLVQATSIASLNLRISYDASMFSLAQDPISGNLLANHAFRSSASTPGELTVGFTGPQPLSGSGTIAWIQFQANGEPGNETTLAITVTEASDPAGAGLEIDRINGALSIVEVAELTPGDCNGDARLTEYDASCALRMSVQLIPERLALDITGDNQVTQQDAMMILQTRMETP